MIINEVILSEKLSEILYHSTKLPNLLNILQKNSFILTPSIGSDSEEKYQTKKDKTYFLSLSRSKTGSYHKDYPNTVLLVLDGDKLNQNFYGKPIDYWDTFPDQKRSEMEDRLFHDKPTIQNASKYIDEIHILIKAKWEEEIPNEYIREILQAKLMAKKLNIPFYIYDDSKDFKNLNKENSISIDKLPRPKKSESDPFRRFSHRRKPKYFDEIFELLNKNEYNKLSRNAKDKLDKLSGFYKNETINSIKSDVNNLRRQYQNRDVIDRLIKEMKKRKLYSIEELASYLVDKYESE